MSYVANINEKRNKTGKMWSLLSLFAFGKICSSDFPFYQVATHGRHQMINNWSTGQILINLKSVSCYELKTEDENFP